MLILLQPDQLSWLSLMYLAKSYPAMFVTSDVAKEALCSLLKRDMKVRLFTFLNVFTFEKKLSQI
jgi:hypothetical protein